MGGAAEWPSGVVEWSREWRQWFSGQHPRKKITGDNCEARRRLGEDQGLVRCCYIPNAVCEAFERDCEIEGGTLSYHEREWGVGKPMSGTMLEVSGGDRGSHSMELLCRVRFVWSRVYL